MQRIASRPDGRLEIEDRPWVIAIGSALACVVLIGIAWRLLLSESPASAWLPIASLVFPGALYLMTERTRLELDADSGFVTLRRKGFFGTAVAQWPACALERARVQRLKNRKSDDTYRVLLDFRKDGDAGAKTESVPFLHSGGQEADAHRAVQAVNAWIAAR